MLTRVRFTREKLATAARQLPYLSRTFRIVWAAAPRRTLLWLTLLFLNGVLPAVTVILTRDVVDSLVLAASRDEARGRPWKP